MLGIVGTYDITNFMNWFVGQAIRILTYCFNILDNITFSGTSLLRVCVFIIIIGALTKVVLTIPGQMISLGKERQPHLTKGEKKAIATNRAYRKGEIGK